MRIYQELKMLTATIHRRGFLATSAGALASIAVGRSVAAEADPRPTPLGPVYGRVGRRGIAPGRASAPARGEVILLDGRRLEVSHVTGQGIRAGASVLLAPDGVDGWSILYAEF